MLLSLFFCDVHHFIGHCVIPLDLWGKTSFGMWQMESGYRGAINVSGCQKNFAYNCFLESWSLVSVSKGYKIFLMYLLNLLLSLWIINKSRPDNPVLFVFAVLWIKEETWNLWSLTILVTLQSSKSLFKSNRMTSVCLR